MAIYYDKYTQTPTARFESSLIVQNIFLPSRTRKSSIRKL